jgi:hypothetical protein
LFFFFLVGGKGDKMMTQPSKRDALCASVCGETLHHPIQYHPPLCMYLRILLQQRVLGGRVPTGYFDWKGLEGFGPGPLDYGVCQCSKVGAVRACYNAATCPPYCFTNFINHEPH